jgi:FkbM family methyltransferase
MFNVIFIRQVGLVKWIVRYTRRQIDKRILNLDSFLRLPTGRDIRLPIQSESATEVYVTNADIDWGSERLFATYADKTKDFLDIGAHIGYYSVYISPLVRHVFAFEPDTRNLPSLIMNATSCGNISVVEKAISDRSGIVPFLVASSSATSHIVDNNAANITIQATSIDDYLESHREINICLIKTDVEGYDLRALAGGKQSIIKYAPLILTECQLNNDLQRFVSSINYHMFAFVRNTLASKPTFEKLTMDSVQGRHLKMIFLVPERLVAAFRSHLADQ